MRKVPLLMAVILLTLTAACAAAATATPAPTPMPTPTAEPTTAPGPGPLKLGLLDLDVIDARIHGTREGSPTTRAVLLAIKHVNAAGGVFGQPVEPHFRSSLDEGDIIQHADSLVDEEGVHALVGPLFSNDLLVIAADIAIVREVPAISPSAASPRISDLADHGFIFRTIMSDDAQGVALARLAADAGYDQVAALHQDDWWGSGVTAGFAEHYAGTVMAVPVDVTQGAWDAELEQAAESGAEALLLVTPVRVAHELVREAAAKGYFENFILVNHNRNLNFYKGNPEALEGAKGVAFYGKHVSEAEGHWEADYRAEYGELPQGPHMREAYDAAVALMLAAEYAGSTEGSDLRDALNIIAKPPGQRYVASGAGIAAALAAIRNGADIDLDGEASNLDWDSRGDIVVGSMGVWQFKDGAVADLYHFEVDLRE